MIERDQAAGGHIADEGVRAACATADAGALQLACVVGFVLQNAPAEGAGAQAVFVRCCSAGDHAAIELRVVAHINLIAALTAEQAGLLLHAFIVGVDLALADAERTTARHGAKRETCATADIGLFGLVVIGVLQALQHKIAAYRGLDLICTDLCTFEDGVSPTDQADLLARIQRRFRPGCAIAFLTAGALVGIGEDAKASTIGTRPKAKAYGPAATAVLAIEFLCVGGCFQADITLCCQQHFITGLELAALNADVSICARRAVTGGYNTEVIATGEAATLACRLLLGLFGAGFLRAERDGDADKFRGVSAGHATILLRRLPRLHPRQPRLHTLQRREAAVVLALGLLGGLISRVHRATNGAGQRQGQTTGFALGGLLATVVVLGSQDADILPNQADVLTGNHVRAANGQVFASLNIHTAQHTADVAGPGGLGAAGEGVLVAA